jgi:hypothetical protein
MEGLILITAAAMLMAPLLVSTPLGAKLFWVQCLIPATWLVLFYSFVMRAYLLLGHWPQPSAPDPNDLGLTWHQTALWLSLPLVIIGAVTFILMVVRDRNQFMQGRYKWGVAFFGITLVAWLLVVGVDPGRFLEWFVD